MIDQHWIIFWIVLAITGFNIGVVTTLMVGLIKIII